MLPGVSGSVVSGHFLAEDLPRLFAGEIGEATRAEASRRARRWLTMATCTIGPATPLRAVVDRAALPLAEVLGFEAGEAAFLCDQPVCAVVLRGRAGATATLIVTTWGADLDAVWKTAVRFGASLRTPWCLCFNATHLRLVDAERTFARRFVEFDLGPAIAHPDSFGVLWALVRAEALAPLPAGPPGPGCARPLALLIDRVVEASAARGVGVCASLKQGVCDALVELTRGFIGARCGTRRAPDQGLLSGVLDESLTVVYRMLFLLYAEARGLLPAWHPVYKESYSIETLRSLAEDPQAAAGLWASFQAMSRLAHAGCRAGDLSVTPFNGRLFSPRVAPLAERVDLDDATVRRAILALSTEPGGGPQGRRRIAYRDLGVEQLGSVYETVLDHEPRLLASAIATRGSAAGRRPARGSSGGFEPGRQRRKATGTFYTPRPITEFLVRSALEPLVSGASAEGILRLRVLDPSMGSGAFLVAACRHLARAYESALLRDGACHPGDVGEAERAGFRRTIAERCLYGVDLNPMAVQLARVSLWLTTLAADRPLTFLDHTLRTGDSLVGASLDDLGRRYPVGSGGRCSRGRPAPLPLFEAEEWHGALRKVLPVRGRLAARPSDTVEDVRSKERDLARLHDRSGILSRWKAAIDLWCACWFWESPRGCPDRRTFGDLVSAILGSHAALPEHTARPLLAESGGIAARRRFFHWTLEFPEAFFEANGVPLANPGFDAVVGNPPWEMLRADAGAGGGGAAGHPARRLIAFARESGVYGATGTGHLNLFQLFLERALQLTRRGGRVGLVLPWGLASDHGCAGLRRALLEKADTDTMVGFENADGVFPIHRSVRFLVLTSTPGARTDRIRCRFGLRDPGALDRVPESARLATAEHFPLVLTPAFIRRVAGDDLAIPDIRTPADLAILERITARFPALASPAGWGAIFSRELNATDDRRFFTPGNGSLTVVDGKHLAPFRVDLAASGRFIREEDAAKRLNPARTYRRARLAYRDVAAASNRLTLIAAVVPAGCVTTHTVFCLRTSMPAAAQSFLCGLLNSYVANYLVRQRVTTHVGAAVIRRIPAPKPDSAGPVFREGADLAAALASAADPEHDPAYARLQALVAHAYRLTEPEFDLILDSFPLVGDGVLAAAREAFRRFSL